MNNIAFHPSVHVAVSKRATADRICLVIPPSLFLLDDRVFMSLGILRVAAVLEDDVHERGVHTFHEIRMDRSRPQRPSAPLESLCVR